ncbi:hypothetical protein F383_05144 [Gossypium arboreum]|uniref:Uncharacterized protein n=1 Tax=Gossypium arboreum TaxID=29729 RepID=A0A0B0PRA4_GOSAR|nr:hypothetical protein F383_05144 [Gossypium arboreum]
MSGTCIGYIMRHSLRPCLGHDIALRRELVEDMSGTCIGLEMCQCKTMSGTLHRHGYVRANVRSCLRHGVGLDFDSQCKTMSGTWHRLDR